MLQSLTIAGGASSSCQPSGLLNLGNSCYINAAIQIVGATTLLSRVIMTRSFQVRAGSDGRLVNSLSTLLNGVLGSDRNKVSPMAFVSVVKRTMSNLNNTGQHDVGDFFCRLLPMMSDETNSINRPTDGPNSVQIDEDDLYQMPGETNDAAEARIWDLYRSREGSPITDLCHGMQKEQWECGDCAFSFTKYVEIGSSGLSVGLPPANSLSSEPTMLDCIEYSLREDDMECFCRGACQANTFGIKKTSIVRLPPVFAITIGRTDLGTYNDGVVDSPRELNLLSLGAKVPGNKNPVYQLVGVVDHTSMDPERDQSQYGKTSGHYTATVRGPLPNEHWQCNDSQVASVGAIGGKSRTSKVAVYQLSSAAGNSGRIPIDPGAVAAIEADSGPPTPSRPSRSPRRARTTRASASSTTGANANSTSATGATSASASATAVGSASAAGGPGKRASSKAHIQRQTRAWAKLRDAASAIDVSDKSTEDCIRSALAVAVTHVIDRSGQYFCSEPTSTARAGSDSASTSASQSRRLFIQGPALRATVSQINAADFVGAIGGDLSGSDEGAHGRRVALIASLRHFQLRETMHKKPMPDLSALVGDNDDEDAVPMLERVLIVLKMKSGAHDHRKAVRTIDSPLWLSAYDDVLGNVVAESNGPDADGSVPSAYTFAATASTERRRRSSISYKEVGSDKEPDAMDAQDLTDDEEEEGEKEEEKEQEEQATDPDDDENYEPPRGPSGRRLRGGRR